MRQLQYEYYMLVRGETLTGWEPIGEHGLFRRLLPQEPRGKTLLQDGTPYNQCPHCGDNVRTNGKFAHFKEKHPEYHFSIDRNAAGSLRYTCECGKTISNCKDLVTHHNHKE